jgi:predicted nucleic acid-binding protein
MIRVFADTFYWVALTNVRDSAHRAVNDFSNARSPVLIVTTEAVLMEYLNHFAGWGEVFRFKASAIVGHVLHSETAKVLPLTTASFRTALDFYAERPDKGYSLTDCISMIAMKEEGLVDALTNDRHFEQEGFRAIFRG